MVWKLVVTSSLMVAASGSVPLFAISPDMSTGLSIGAVGVAVAPDEDAYAQGTRAMNERRWPDAVHAFDEVIAAKTARRTEAALYWKAYSLSKMSRQVDAAASCEVLRAKYPASSWNNDCGALSINVQVDQKNMQVPVVVVPDGVEVGSSAKPGSDEDLKLLALNSLARQDPSRAIPLLRNILSNSPSPEMRKHAIFVLAQSKSPEAAALLNDVAMGKMGVPLQAQAIRMMGVFEGKRANDTLAEVYRTSKDVEVKRAVISAFFISQDAPRMVEMARNEKDLDMKRTIVSQLALMNDKAATDYMLELLK